MHVVSSNEMEAHEADQARAFPLRFQQWWQDRVSPRIERQFCQELVMRHQEEFQLAGVEEDEEKFLFLYARALMPEMGDAEYLETMDMIFALLPEAEKIRGLGEIARRFGHRG